MARNKNRFEVYFKQKDIIRPIALGVVIAGIVTIWLPLSWIAYALATILIPGGLITYIVSAAKTVSHDEVPDRIKRAMIDYDSVYTETKEYRTEVLKHPAPIETETHEYGERAVMFKKLKDCRVISDVYRKTHLYFTKEKLVIVSRCVSLMMLDDLTRAGIEDEFKKIPFDEITDAFIEEKSYIVTLSDTEKPHDVKQFELVLIGGDDELARLAVRNDVSIEGLCEEIKRRGKMS